jgi:hypothetical protein
MCSASIEWPGRHAGIPTRLQQALQPEQADIVARHAHFSQVRHDLADDAGELEAVSRAG